MSVRRLGPIVTLVAVLGLLPVAVVALRQIGSTPEGAGGAGERRSGPVAMSSPVDPEARFYWELSDPGTSLIDLDQIVSGGPPPDGIPPIDHPIFETVPQADGWLEDREPVLAFERDGVARAYPIQILTWHEIVNDVVAGEPVIVSYCPLCNSAIVYSRRVDDRVLDFGTSGRLYLSDLVMYDRQTKSMWPQIEGRAVVGALVGTELERLPSSMLSWRQWKTAHPDGEVLTRRTGFDRPYGRNPYVGYDADGRRPFLFSGEPDARLPVTERVVAVQLSGEAKAYPFSTLRDRSPAAIHDRIGGTDVVVFFSTGTASALDTAEIARGRDVGASGVFRPVLDGTQLSFEVRDGAFTDRETGSRWNLLGRAFAGPLQGEHLDQVPHIDTFWFAWAAFEPDTTIWRP